MRWKKRLSIVILATATFPILILGLILADKPHRKAFIASLKEEWYS